MRRIITHPYDTGGNDLGFAVAVSPKDQSVYAGGDVETADGYEALMMKLDPNGVPIWERRLAERTRDVFYDLRQAPSPPKEIVVVSVEEHSIKRYGRRQGRAPRRLARRFDAALEQYFEGRFGTAETMFSELLRDFPEDGPSLAFVERCRVYQTTPPAPDWAGVYVATTK